MRGLKAYRVVDHSTTVAGAYCGKLFADGGADVIKLESGEAGDPMRAVSATGGRKEGEDGVLFRYLNGGKRSVRGELKSPLSTSVQSLLEGADLIIEDRPPTALDRATLVEAFPGLVWLTITPYGLTGPLADRPATDFTIQAESGSIGARGRPGAEPYQAGGELSGWTGGSFAAVSALAAMRHARRTGQGEHIDFSLHEVTALSTNCYIDLMWGILGRPPALGSLPNLETPSIEPTKDGFVGFTTYSAQQMSDFLLMIGREDLRESEEFSQFGQRLTRLDEFEELVHAYTREHSTHEIVELAQMFRIPVSPICNGQTVLDQEQLKARDVFVEDPSGGFLRPAAPYRIDGERPPLGSPAPSLGEHEGQVESRTVERPVAQAERHRPLEGLRVVDCTTWWAGPIATQMLAMLGAEVIHVESIQRMDGSRSVGGAFAAQHEDWWECSFIYLSANSNKRGITLDLSDPKGREALDRLIAEADVLVENFSPRVMEGFGVTWEHVQSVNPRCHYVRMPAFGLDGPWRDNVGFAATMEQMAGLSWLTGHVTDQPRIQRGPCDPMAGVHAAFALLLALEERDMSGRGHFVECCMLEAALNVTAQQVGEYTAYGEIMGRAGNRSPGTAPQGLYPCQGHHITDHPQWLALSVETEAQWRSLVAWLGSPDWAGDCGPDLESRMAKSDVIDEALRGVFAERDLGSCVEELLAEGVPAAKIVDPRTLAEHPQLVARGFFDEVDHPLAGSQRTMSAPFRYRSVPHWLRSAAPLLGQHNAEVLAELGYTAAEIEQLEEGRVIGSWPEGV
ncbi:MAG: CaiB/BaiF CoA transferase family protein [Myxococcota bacterium]